MGDSDTRHVTVINADSIGYSAGRAVASELKPVLNNIRQGQIEMATAMATAMAELGKQVNELAYKMVELEVMKYTSRMEALDESKMKLEVMYEDIKSEANKEYNEIQILFDTAIFELLDSLTQTIQANTKNIEILKKDYRYVSDLYTSFFSDSDRIGEIGTLGHNIRKVKLNLAEEKVIENLQSFLDHREGVLKLINELQVELPIKEESILYVPIWVAGMADRSGEQVRIYPVSEYEAQTEAPILQKPYIDCIGKLSIFDFSEILKDEKGMIVISEKDRKNAIWNSILPRADQIIDTANGILGKRVYRDEKGKSLFLETARRFLTRRGAA